MSVAVPPPRPSKSKLRSLNSDRSSSGSSIMSQPPLSPTGSYKDILSLTSNDSNSKLRLNSPIPSYNNFPLPKRSKYRSRFTEHFEPRKTTSTSTSTSTSISEQQLQQHEQGYEAQIEQQHDQKYKNKQRNELEEQDDVDSQQETNIKKYNIGKLKGSQSLTSLPTESSFLRHSNSINKKKGDTETGKYTNDAQQNHQKLHQPKIQEQQKQQEERPIQLKSSKSTPLQETTFTGRKRIGSSGSIKLGKSLSSTKLAALGNHNRAHIIIRRYENWLVFLKSMIGWLDETSKISMTTSRAFSSRAAPHLKPKEGIQTIRSGLKVLTKHISERQQDFSKQLDKHVHIITDLKKVCKEKITKLKSDPRMAMDELLRRAEVTRGKMNHLHRCCKQADKLKSQLEMDPWLANLYVLRQLKKEVDEDNRLRLLMVTIQQEMRTFEKQLISTVKVAVEYSYTNFAPNVWDGSDDPETAPFKQILDEVMPDHEWQFFYEQNANDLVDEEQPIKDYLKFNYPNKLHPAVMTLRKGKMERKFGVRKQFVQRYFVLSQGGYLHQFRLDDKVSPERTLFVPGTVIIPSVDIHAGQESVESLYSTPPVDGFTFEMFKHSTAVLQRDKSTTFRAETREDMVTWCRLISMVANGLDPSVIYELSSFPSFSSSFEELKSKSTVRRGSSRISKSISSQPEILEESEIPVSPTRSEKSRKTIESFNEPFYMNKDDTQDEKQIQESQDKKQKDMIKEDEIVVLEVEIQQQQKKMANGMVSKEKEMERKEEEQVVNGVTNTTPPSTPPETIVIHETILEEDEPATDTESFVTASRHDNESDYDDGSDKQSINSVATARGPSSKQTPTSPSFVSTNYDDAISHVSTNYGDAQSISSRYTDAQSSVYFSSHSSNNSNRSSVASMPDLSWDLTDERIQTYNPNLNI